MVEHKRNSWIESGRSADQSLEKKIEQYEIGLCGELAASYLFNVWPLAISGDDMMDYDIVIDDMKFDVKATDLKGDDIHMTINPNCLDKEVDAFVMFQKVHDWAYKYRGRISVARVRQFTPEMRGGTSPCYYIPMKALK